MAFSPELFDPNKRPIGFQNYASAFHEVVTHTRGYNVGRFLRLRRPNEPEDFYAYRMANYQALTLGAWLRVEDKASRILTSPKFNYSTSDYLYDAIITPKDYNGLDYFRWVSQIFMRRMLEDANGYKVWMPYGEGVINPAKKVELNRYLVYSTYMVEDPAENEYDRLVFCQPEAIHYWGKDDQNREMNYWAIDREWYWKIERQGEKGNWIAIPYYRHGLGELPITKIPGIYTSANNIEDWNTARNNFGSESRYYPYANKDMNQYSPLFANYVDYKKSFFAGFIPSANTALVHFADAEAANLSCAYPIRIEEWSPCSNKSCGVGTIKGHILLDNGTTSICPDCNGDGVHLPNPLGRYVRRRYPAGMDDKEFVTQPIEIIPGEAQAVKILYEQAFAFIQRAETDVWLKDTDKVMSAEQVVAGNEGSRSMIKKMGDAVFAFIEADLFWAEALTHGSSTFEAPEIDTPVDYEVREESELLNTMISLSGSDVPTSVKVKYEKDIARMQTNGKDEAVRIIDIKMMWDILYGKSDTEVSTAIGIGGMKPEIASKHFAVEAIMTRLLARNGKDWLYPNESETQQASDARIMADMDAEFESMNLNTPTLTIV